MRDTEFLPENGLSEDLPDVPERASQRSSQVGRSDNRPSTSNLRGLASAAATASRTLVSRLTSKGRAPRVKVLKDAEELKRQLQIAIHEGKSVYNVESLYWEDGVMQKIAKSSIFQNTTLFMIFGYALWLSYDTDENDASTLIEADVQFQVMEHIFCTYFLVELVIRFLAFKSKRHAFYDGWFIFDSFLVTLGVAEAWIMSIVLLLTNSQDSSVFANSSSLRLLRLLRLSRVARTARLLRAAPELLIMVKGMIAAARSMLTTGVLVIGVLYVFGIAMRQATVGTEGGAQYFGTVWKSMFSLLVYATLLDSPAEVMSSLNEVGVAIFLLVIALSALLLLNMLIGVMCEVVSGVSQTEREVIAEAFVREKVQLIVQRRHGKSEVPVSRKELIDMLHDREATSLLNEAGVDVIGLVDVADFVFNSDDGETGDQELSFQDFLRVVMALRGSNAVTLKDIMDLRRTLHKHHRELRGAVHDLEERTVRSSGVPVPPSPLSRSHKIYPGNTIEVSASLGVSSLCEAPPSESLGSRIPLPCTIEEEQVPLPPRPAWQRKLKNILEHQEIIEERQMLVRQDLQELMQMLPEASISRGFTAGTAWSDSMT